MGFSGPFIQSGKTTISNAVSQQLGLNICAVQCRLCMYQLRFPTAIFGFGTVTLQPGHSVSPLLSRAFSAFSLLAWAACGETMAPKKVQKTIPKRASKAAAKKGKTETTPVKKPSQASKAATPSTASKKARGETSKVEPSYAQAVSVGAVADDSTQMPQMPEDPAQLAERNGNSFCSPAPPVPEHQTSLRAMWGSSSLQSQKAACGSTAGTEESTAAAAAVATTVTEGAMQRKSSLGDMEMGLQDVPEADTSMNSMAVAPASPAVACPGSHASVLSAAGSVTPVALQIASPVKAVSPTQPSPQSIPPGQPTPPCMRTPYSDSNLLDLGFLFEDGQASSSHGKDAVVAMDCGREPESAALPALPLTEHNLRKFEASVDINSDRDRSRTPPRTPPRQRRKSISNGAPQSPVLAMMSILSRN